MGMAPVVLEGSARDPERFANGVLGATASVEAIGDSEQRVLWQVGDQRGSSQRIALRSGMALTASRVTWEQPWSLAFHHAPMALKLVLMRGAGPTIRTSDGTVVTPERSAPHIMQFTETVRMQFDFAAHGGGAPHEELALEIDPRRFAELLGGNPAGYPKGGIELTPELHRLFDEVAGADSRRPSSRQVFLEAKGLELVAAISDAMADHQSATAPHLSALDVDRLEMARRLLLERLADPPSLRELARHAGVNEAKLKAGFRARYDHAVFGYLRKARMEEALRLLRARRLNVTEVALRVGYSNPSKFAAAFRRHFGRSPSEAT